MKIKLSKEQISEIANEVVSTISGPRMAAVRARSRQSASACPATRSSRRVSTRAATTAYS